MTSRHFTGSSPTRRGFLTTTGAGLAAALPGAPGRNRSK
ncbi:twin-arginine translocation signal domain-containing protein [Arthrobacter sp. SDTb3-6]